MNPSIEKNYVQPSFWRMLSY